MTTMLGVAALMMLTATAAAESYDATQPTPPNNTYVIAGGSVGGQRDLRAGLQLEAGRSLSGESRLFVRGQLSTGKNTQDGDYQQARVGFEGRGCVVREFFCAFSGIDAGYQHDHVDMQPWSLTFAPGSYEPRDRVVVDAHDLIVVPRAGVEMGHHIKTRLALELPFARRLDSKMDSDSSDGGMGLALSLGFGYSF